MVLLAPLQSGAETPTETPGGQDIGLVPVRSTMLAQLKGIEHAFFGREGGVSTGIYDSLNAGTGSDDAPEAVSQNRQRIAQHLNVTSDRLLSPYQVHGADALVVDGPFANERPQVDGLVTRCPSLAVSVLSADCAPVLFADPTARVVAAAHAGWKGALGGVLNATLNKMVKLGASKARIVAAIGPCIGAASYEVGPEFEAVFLAADPDNARFFVPGLNDRPHFDLKRYCAARLRAAGVGVVDVLHHDTYALESGFYSNRRRVQRGEPDYGRQLSAIKLLK
jgi:polyphenol oxidase